MINDALTLEIFEALMAQNTINPPGNEKRGALCLKEIFDREGIPCEVQDLGDNRANFIASFGEGDKILEYSGHLDVVPCVGNWQHTAIGTTEEGDLIYGRGACDMKGGVAAMCSAAISMFRDKTPLNGQIRLTFVADEEDANLGMHAFLDSHKAATYTILGEPTDLHVAIAHRGVGRYYIDLLGHACHAALRSTEETAVAKAARAVMAIEDLNKQLENMTHDVLPSPSIAVTMVQGYEKDNVVPGKVRLLVDFRVLPGMTEPQTRKLVQDALDAHGIVGFELTKHFFMPGGEVAQAHPFVSACVEQAEKLNERKEAPQAFGASCEQCFLVEAGSATVIIGPGSLDQAHTVDEFVEKAQLLRAAKLYREIAMDVLK
ncbi:MAG: M20 family metallopeptidase [Christensenellales bacterium]